MPIARETLIATINQFVADYPGAAPLGFVVAETVEDMLGPDVAPANTLGFYIRCKSPENQSLVLLPRANADSEDNLLSTLRHEVLGHFGLDTFSPRDKAALLDCLIEAREARYFKAVWAHVESIYGDAPLRQQAEEVFALRAQFVRPPLHTLAPGVTQAGQASFEAVCVERQRPMAFDDFENIVLMVAQGLHTRTRVQRNFAGPEVQLALNRTEPRKPLAETVAESLIAQLEAGTSPLQCPWSDVPSEFRVPFNATTGKRYKGGNAVWLMMQGRPDPRWLTYKQAAAAGAQVRKGERGTPIQYWRFEEERPSVDESGRPLMGPDGKALTHTVRLERPRAFTATVFNADQVDGLPPLAVAPPQTWEAERRAERVLQASGANLSHTVGSGAFYRPSTDTIHLPDRGQFETAARYYAIALHELGHWTGHPTRLDRNIAHPFGSAGYAKEELRAEIASLLLGTELGIGHDPGQHAAYVGSWIKALRNDPAEIFRAASDAEAIFDFVLAFEKQQSVSEQPGKTVAEETAMQNTPYDIELTRLLALSTLTPGEYTPTEAMTTGMHAAVFQGEKAILLCGPADDPASMALARRLAASPILDALLQADGEGDPLHAGMVAGRYLEWLPCEAAIVAKPSGQIESGGDEAPLIMIVRDDPLRALTTVLCVNDTLARIIDPDAPSLDDGSTLAGLARVKAEAAQSPDTAPARLAAVAQENAAFLGQVPMHDARDSTSSKGVRMFLDVPFKEKDEAKALGAKWDRTAQAWFVPRGIDAEPFARWIRETPAQAIAGTAPTEELAGTTTQPARVFLCVPYGERVLAKAEGALWDKAAKSWYIGPNADPEKLQRWSLDAVPAIATPALPPNEEFADALRALGCVVDGAHPFMDGKTHRIPVEGDKRGERSGFYVGHLDGHPAGYVKNNRTGLDIRWKSKGYALDENERARLAATAADKLQERAHEVARTQQATAARLSASLAQLQPVTEPTPYLARKGIAAVPGLYTDAANTTIIPAIDVDGRHWTVQYVQADGTKRFAKNSRKEGCFHAIGGLERLAEAPVIVIAEGYATAASLSQGLGGLPTVVAFDAGNLEAVATALHERWPQKPILIAGDDDRHLAKNPGRRFAEAAAGAVGGQAVFPIFASGEQDADPHGFTDFNDLATQSTLGPDAIERQLAPVLASALSRHAPVALQLQEVVKARGSRRQKARAA